MLEGGLLACDWLTRKKLTSDWLRGPLPPSTLPNNLENSAHPSWKGIHAHLLLLNKLMLLGEKLSLLHLLNGRIRYLKLKKIGTDLKLVLRLSMLNLLPDDVWNLVLHVSTRIELVLVTVSILLHRSRYLSLFRA